MLQFVHVTFGSKFSQAFQARARAGMMQSVDLSSEEYPMNQVAACLQCI
jgi:hypothetical protein